VSHVPCGLLYLYRYVSLIPRSGPIDFGEKPTPGPSISDEKNTASPTVAQQQQQQQYRDDTVRIIMLLSEVTMAEEQDSAAYTVWEDEVTAQHIKEMAIQAGYDDLRTITAKRVVDQYLDSDSDIIGYDTVAMFQPRNDTDKGTRHRYHDRTLAALVNFSCDVSVSFPSDGNKDKKRTSNNNTAELTSHCSSCTHTNSRARCFGQCSV
jgi:hypothetical protein